MIDHDQVQAALSARIDGEPAGLPDDVIDTHVAACGECRAFQDRVAFFSSSLRAVEPGGFHLRPPADLADSILAGVEPEWRRLSIARQTWLAVGRIALMLLAVAHVVWAVMLIGEGGIESAALRLGLAAGLALCSWRPGLIGGFAIVPATVTTFLLGFTARDLIFGLVDPTQVQLLVLLAVTVAALLATFVADRGVQLRQAWRTISADPR